MYQTPYPTVVLIAHLEDMPYPAKNKFIDLKVDFHQFRQELLNIKDISAIFKDQGEKITLYFELLQISQGKDFVRYEVPRKCYKFPVTILISMVFEIINQPEACTIVCDNAGKILKPFSKEKGRELYSSIGDLFLIDLKEKILKIDSFYLRRMGNIIDVCHSIFLDRTRFSPGLGQNISRFKPAFEKLAKLGTRL